MSRDLLLFLEDIEKSCAKIILYTAGLTRDEVFTDEMRFDAILRNLHIIGEAVKNLPQDWRRKHADIPWRELAGLRDFVAHAYFALDLEILWSAIKDEVPALLRRVQEILEQEQETQGA
ncbi:MAG: DUF86 domain-containing protein [Acidobacteriota bacterium]